MLVRILSRLRRAVANARLWLGIILWNVVNLRAAATADRRSSLLPMHRSPLNLPRRVAPPPLMLVGVTQGLRVI